MGMKRKLGFVVLVGVITACLHSLASASEPPKIISDPSLLSSENWAACHQHNATDGIYQQMSIRAKAGALYTIESSEDLVNWSTDSTHYGYYHGSDYRTTAVQAQYPRPIHHQETPRRPPHRTSVHLMLRDVPSGGILASWQPIDWPHSIQYHLPNRTLHQNWSSMPIASVMDDDYSISAMYIGSYTGESIPVQDPALEGEDSTFANALGALFDTMNTQISNLVFSPPTPVQASPGSRTYYRIRVDYWLDSDGDGLSDSFEIAEGLNPFDPDTDQDGVSDWGEVMSEIPGDANDPSSKPTVFRLHTITRHQGYDYDDYPTNQGTRERSAEAYWQLPPGNTVLEDPTSLFNFDFLDVKLAQDYPFPPTPPEITSDYPIQYQIQTWADAQVLEFPYPCYHSDMFADRVWVEQIPASDSPRKRGFLKITERNTDDSPSTHVTLEEVVIPAEQTFSPPIDLTPQLSSTPSNTDDYYEFVEMKLIALEAAPDVLTVNSDFDEGRIDPDTGYAIPDCDDVPDVDRKTGAGNGALRIDTDLEHLDGLFANDERITQDLHRGWFGVNPNRLDNDFWDGATVTIKKINKTNPDTGQPESGQIRFYAKWGETYYGIIPYDLTTLVPNNLVTGGVNGKNGEGVYGSTSTIPGNAEYWMEGVRPGKITLEWRMQKGSTDVAYEQTFLVATQKSKEKWVEDVFYQVKLQSSLPMKQMQAAGGYMHALTAFPIDLDKFDPTRGFFIQSLSTNYVYIQSIYHYYAQLFEQFPEEFHWAGMAKVAGAAVYAGMVDMNTWRFLSFHRRC